MFDRKIFNHNDSLVPNAKSDMDIADIANDLCCDGYTALGLATVVQAILDYMKLFNNLNENQLAEKSIKSNKRLMYLIKKEITFFESDWFDLLSSSIIDKDYVYRVLREKGYYVPKVAPHKN